MQSPAPARSSLAAIGAITLITPIGPPGTGLMNHG
jgi:hypothetical protein